MSSVLPCLIPSSRSRPPEQLGDPLLDRYLEFLAARCRPNSVLAAWFDLRVFFTAVGKPVQGVTAADVLGFITAQRTGARSLPDPLPEPLLATASTAGVSLRTVRRRLSTIAGLYAFLTARGDVPANPVPRGLPTRRERHRPAQGVPLVRAPRTLPRILAPAEVDALTAALRTHRDRAMVAAMVLGGLRRREVLALRLDDVRAAQRRLFIASGKGGHQRLVPISGRFFEHLSAYLEQERPVDAASDMVFLVLKRPRRGARLSAYGLDEVLAGAREPAGLAHASCHELRHTCLTRLRRPGCRWRPSKPRPGTPRSNPPGSICTWPMTGSPRSTARRPRSSTPRCSRSPPRPHHSPTSSVTFPTGHRCPGTGACISA